MTKHKDIWGYICANSLEYYREVIKPEGLPYFIRAMTAKLLWVILWYMIGVFLMGKIFFFENIIYSNVGTLILGGVLIQFWDKVIKEHMPQWFDDLITGRIFFEVDIRALNRYISILFVAIIMFLIPPAIWQQLKFNKNE